MIVQRRHVLEVALVVAEVETHVEEQLSGLLVFLHFRRWQTINQPIDSIVFSYAVVDELGVAWGNCVCAQDLACCIILHHVNLRRDLALGFNALHAWNTGLTSYGELNIRSPNRIDPRLSGSFLGPPSGLQKWKAGL